MELRIETSEAEEVSEETEEGPGLGRTSPDRWSNKASQSTTSTDTRDKSMTDKKVTV